MRGGREPSRKYMPFRPIFTGSRLTGLMVSQPRERWRLVQMLDMAMLAIGLGFFALAMAYGMACDRL
ncbi:hypothetical protein EET67_11215 [Pseudaminobacter arsenicus]|uniref:Uncharacterized protein n=1 Tax=Borborobacter arsenicus TaxID=1851146 RepID=A0A432V634_9HYPH|nr:hypothetical protein [Pseudaminobacter arsenicus]RUM97634.1 hypothetical protein EET67_11215 [Pseudaminobacter arsenicus]